MITVLIQHVRSYLDSESAAMHTPTELVNKTCELNFWQAIAAAIKDSYAMERWTEALLREMVIANLNDVEAYWIIWMLFDEIFKNKASIRFLSLSKMIYFSFICLSEKMQTDARSDYYEFGIQIYSSVRELVDKQVVEKYSSHDSQITTRSQTM